MRIFPRALPLLALPAIGLTGLLLAGCVAPAGGVVYGGNAPYDGSLAYGADYYEPFGAEIGGWGPGYRIGPFRGDEHFHHFGYGHHAFRPVGAFHGIPSLPHGGGHIHIGGHGGHGGRR
jgi:hypothetical protein